MHRDQLPIAAPCHADWASMTPAQGGRFCGDCKKVVRDLSRMTRDEAQELLSAPGRADLCVRYIYDARGKVFFREAQANLVPAGLLHKAKRAALTAAAMSLAACSDPSSMFSEERTEPGPGIMMGGMPAPDPRPVEPPKDGGSDADAQGDPSVPDASPNSSDAGADAQADAEPVILPD